MKLGYAPLIALAVALAGCGNLGSTAAAGGASAAASAPPPASSAAPSPAPRTTHACIATEAQQNLVGLVAQDNSVSTKAVCKASTVKHNAGNTWTVWCTVTYSDGNETGGYANILSAQNKITFEPQ